MNIASLIESEANVQIVVTLSDLKEFALAVASEVIAAKEAEKKEETYLTTDEVCDIAGVSKNTLWRWDKNNYLIPVKFGRKSFYKRSDIDKILEGIG